MAKPLLVAAFLLLFQAGKPQEFGIVAGAVAPPQDMTISEPLQVILLSPLYGDLWNSDVQKRLDVYWERYKPAFAQKKEFFFEISRMAQRDAIQFVVGRMRRELRNDISAFIQQTSREGRFEFKNVPFGEYKIVALGKVGEQEFIWQESIHIKSPIPHFLELKQRIP